MTRFRADRKPSDINALILDYLTMEGYPGAAANFSKEANLAPQQADPSIKTRQEIQHAIHSGDIETAITALNTLDSDVSLSILFTPRCYDLTQSFMHHA